MRTIPIQREIVRSASPKVKQLFTSWMKSRVQHITISGPRRCSKTVHEWLLILWFLQQLPVKVCVIRPEAASLRRTILRTLLDKILAYAANDPMNPFRLYLSPLRLEAENGGVIDFVGFDDPGKLQGAEYDIVYFNEIARIEETEGLSHVLATMAAGSAGNIVIGGERRFLFLSDCNPGSEYHPYYERYYRNLNPEKELWLDFLHQEHPLCYDWSRREQTQYGKNTVDDLLLAYPPGYMRDRMVFGKWNVADGLIYPMWNQDIHVKELTRNFFPKDTIWRVAVDWGDLTPHSHPNALGIVGEFDGKHYVYKEIFGRMLGADLLDKMEDLLEREDIDRYGLRAVFADHRSEFVDELEHRGYPVVLADKKVLGGIEASRRMIANGEIFVNAFSLEERDPDYTGPQGLKEEILSYQVDTEYRLGEKPLKKNDHAMDWFRYYCKGVEASGYIPEGEPMSVRL